MVHCQFRLMINALTWIARFVKLMASFFNSAEIPTVPQWKTSWYQFTSLF